MKLWIRLMLTVCVLLVGLTAAAHEDEGVYARIAHLSPSAPAVDVYVNGEMAATGLEYKGVSDYAMLAGEAFEAVIVPAGGTVDEAVNAEPIPLMFPEMNGYYTIAAIGSLDDGTFELFVLPADGAKDEMMAAGSISISGAYARATASGGMGSMGAEATQEAGHMGGMGEVSAAYMLIENTGEGAEILIGAATDAAETTEIHQTVVENDMARMQPIPALEIPAGGSVELMPGGYHVMMMGLKQSLMAGDTLTVTLMFESGLEVTVTMPVRELGM